MQQNGYCLHPTSKKISLVAQCNQKHVRKGILETVVQPDHADKAQNLQWGPGFLGFRGFRSGPAWAQIQLPAPSCCRHFHGCLILWDVLTTLGSCLIK